MKRLTTYLLCAATLFLGWNAIMAKPDPPKKKLGPEWTKDKDDDDLYRRKMEIELLRRPIGWYYTGYTIPLENHTVNIMESDENRGVNVVIISRVENSALGEFKIRKDVKGKVRDITAQLNDVYNYDLDGDGMIDAIVDKRKGKNVAKIVYEGRFVQVETNKDTFGHAPNQKPEVWGVGRKVRYIFEDGTWKVKS